MALSDLGDLASPSPLLDRDLTVDAFAGAACGDAPGRVALRLASGDVVDARVTVPVEGVLRVRIGNGDGAVSPMLVPGLPDIPADVRDDGAGVVVTGPGVEARWHHEGGGFEFGPARRPAGAGGIVTSAFAVAGRALRHGEPCGWVETLALAPDAAVFGGGESYQGPDLRGRVRRLVNVETHGATGLDASYLNVPFVWSDAGWGILAHTGAPCRLDAGATHGESLALHVEDDVFDLFYAAGEAPELLAAYHRLTGLPGALPEWAFGVWTSRCSYLSEAEIHTVLDEYEAGECPVDVVHVDAWVAGNVIEELTCNWTVDRERFPDGWVQRLADRGVRVSLWHNPYVLAGSPRAAELDQAGLLVLGPDGRPAATPDKPDRHLVDFTSPAAVAWWKERVRETVEREGNVAFKPDFAEELPLDACLHDGRRGRAARNEYALRYQQATHEALQEALGDEAVALFCRSGTAGAQRYPCHWVGDSPSTWSGLTEALRACLSLALSGFGFPTHDVGGFWTAASFEPMRDAFESMDGSAVAADVAPDLFARWAQWGALSPVMRFHGTGRREPVAYPEPARSVAVGACRLRRRLHAYLCRAAAETATTGVPMVRPMPLAYPSDRAARDADLQYLLGPDVLVAPVLDGSGRRSLWVPPGRWRALWGLGDVEGPGWTTLECPLDAFPAFVREGADWPLGEE